MQLYKKFYFCYLRHQCIFFYSSLDIPNYVSQINKYKSMKTKSIQFLTLLFASILIGHLSTHACTNFLVTKGASTDGSTMITYAADSHVLYGELYHWPEADYPEGAKLKIYEWDTGKYLGKIPQPRHTYNVVGNINEHQVALGETTYGGRSELRDT